MTSGCWVPAGPFGKRRQRPSVSSDRHSRACVPVRTDRVQDSLRVTSTMGSPPNHVGIPTREGSSKRLESRVTQFRWLRSTRPIHLSDRAKEMSCDSSLQLLIHHTFLPGARACATHQSPLVTDRLPIKRSTHYFHSWSSNGHQQDCT